MLLWFKIKWFLFFWICWDSFCSPGIFFCIFLLLYRMFSACQWSNSALQVFFILTGLLGFWFCFFLSISETESTFPSAAVDSSDSFFRGWAGWMTALIQWPWIWANPRRWWRTGSLACCSPWGRRESDAPEQPSAPESGAPVFPRCTCLWIVMAPLLSLCNVPLYLWQPRFV